MTQRGNAIIIQVIISIFVIVWVFFSTLFVEAICIDDIFSEFQQSNYQAILEKDSFFRYAFHYFVICGLIGFFGIYTRNMITNLLGILWAVPSFGWLERNFALFQPYFFTTWEGGLFLVDIGARVMVLLITIVGIIVTCRSRGRYYKRKAKQQR